ncbi:C-glycoside deglycosidase beta subunit domain-containing protein [Naasia aerilata]|uniref:C-deglycosylation enzyme beta subunit n=1 Tax=Naasia aerilata TaxID=1162966 RepID=A0ABM8G7F7_9MICO|nr:DUF6379 domain-containing protein [Naasia aerilata]BDZ44097.1 hypothetical protein GCM10025866_00060 [Naasia aerilata]BDZ47709.1 hypothetical protein GCM10025866_36180 [Naasia aerilata]
MFDRYIIVENSLRNVRQGSDVVGFAFDARCGYYRRLILSMVEELDVEVDGTPVPRQDVSLTVGGRTYSLDEMRSEYKVAWEFGEPATVTVAKPGGLPAGPHDIRLAEQLRISYLPVPHTPVTTQTLTVSA